MAHHLNARPWLVLLTLALLPAVLPRLGPQACAQTLQPQAQLFPNAVDAQGLPHGSWIFYYDSLGQPATPQAFHFYRTTQYTSGIPSDTTREFYRNGQLKFTGMITQENPSRFTGAIKYYSPEGLLLKLVVHHADGAPNTMATLKAMGTVLEGLRKAMARQAQPTTPVYLYLNEALNITANQHALLNQLPQSQELLEEALALLNGHGQKTTTDLQAYAQTHGGLGLVALQMGHYGQAEQHYLECQAIMTSLNDTTSKNYAQALHQLGYLAYRKGQYANAEPLLLRARMLTHQLVGQQNLAYAEVVNNLGNLYRDMGAYRKAEPLLGEAGDIVKAIFSSQHPYYAYSLSNQAGVLQEMGSLEPAQAKFEQALAIMAANLGKDHLSYGIVLDNLSTVHEDMGHYGKALDLAQEAHQILKSQVGEAHADYGISLLRLGELQWKMGHLDQAGELMEQSLAVITAQLGTQHLQYAKHLRPLALLHWQRGNFDTAQQLLTQSLETVKSQASKQHILYMDNLADLACITTAMGQTTTAHAHWQQYLSLANGFLQNYFDALGEGRREALYTNFVQNLERFYNFAHQHHNEHPDLLNDFYNLRLAHKAILLNTANTIKRRIQASGDRTALLRYQEVQALRQQLGQLQLRAHSQDLPFIDSLRQVLGTKDRELAQLSSYYTQSQQPVHWHMLRERLQKGEVAVEVVRFRAWDFATNRPTGQVHYGALAVSPKTKRHPLWVEWPNGIALEEEALANYANAIRYRFTDMHSYQHFWLPLQAVVKGNSRVYLSADGVLHQIGWSSLYHVGKDRYLGQEIEVRPVTSTRDLLKPASTATPSRLALLVGNPAFEQPLQQPLASTANLSPAPLLGIRGGMPQLLPLPGAEKEVRQLDSLFALQGNWRHELLTGSAAREQALDQMLKPTVLHLATHGYFNPMLTAPPNTPTPCTAPGFTWRVPHTLCCRHKRP